MNKNSVLFFTLFIFPAVLSAQVPNTFFLPSADQNAVLLGTLSFCNCVCEEIQLEDGVCKLFLHNFVPHEWNQIEQKILLLHPRCTVSLKAEKNGSSCVFTYDATQISVVVSRAHRLDGTKLVLIQFFNQDLLSTLNQKTKKSILQYVVVPEPLSVKKTRIL